MAHGTKHDAAHKAKHSVDCGMAYGVEYNTPKIASDLASEAQPFSVATEYHRAEWQDRMQVRFRRVMLVLILISLALALIAHGTLAILGYRVHRYTQGELTVRSYGQLIAAEDGTTTPKGSLYYDNGLTLERLSDAEWECSDGSRFYGQMQDGFFAVGTHKTAAYTYTGTFFANRPYGQGELTYPDGTRYQGAFENGLFCGQGTLTYPDGSYLVGSFVGGLRHGEVTHYRADGTPLRVVTYENDLPVSP